MDVSCDLLAGGYAVRFRASGGSMRPAICDGDVVTVAPGATPPAGAVVVTGGGGGGFVTKYDCQIAATAKHRKMARKTRFSMETRRLYGRSPAALRAAGGGTGSNPGGENG